MSAVKQLITINCIQNNKKLGIIYVCIFNMYINTNTHACAHLNKYVMFIYNININMYIFQYIYMHVCVCLYTHSTHTHIMKNKMYALNRGLVALIKIHNNNI